MSSSSTHPVLESNSSKPSWSPKDYQKRAIQMMLQEPGVGLLLDPGLGKTSVTLAAFSLLKKAGLVKRMLVIAPLRPCYVTWPNEIKKWAEFQHLRYVIVHGRDKEEATLVDADIYIVNVDAVKWLFDKDQNRWLNINADVLCVDESTKFKHTNTERFKSIKPALAKFKRRWILTGTPAPNGLLDLFGQLFIVDLGTSLGRFITHFKREFFEEDLAGFNWIPRPGAFEQIVERIKGKTLRMRAEDYLNMPELITQDVMVRLPESARAIYKKMEDDFLVMLGDDPYIAANAAVAGGKCRQIANGAMYTIPPAYEVFHDEKIRAVLDLVEELSGQPVLITYEYKHDYDRLSKVLPAPNLTGMSGKSVVDAVQNFSSGNIPVLYGHPASMGHGIDGLQGACHHIIMFGITWDLELYDQVIARIWRQGQQNNFVIVHRILAERTMDVKVAKMLLGKDRTQRALSEALKA